MSGLAIALTIGIALVMGRGKASPRRSEPTPFAVVGASIADLEDAMAGGRLTSHTLVLQYLARIAAYRTLLHPTITVNPAALDEADALDQERAHGHLRGPLHGIPIAVKDNIQTTDMPTTGGAWAFRAFVPPYDATLVTRLKAAGALIIAKTVLTELAGAVTDQMPAKRVEKRNATAGL